MMDSTFHSPLSTPIRSAAPPGHYYHAEFRVMAIIYCLGSSSSGPLLSHLCSICLMKLVASGRSSYSLCLPILSPPSPVLLSALFYHSQIVCCMSHWPFFCLYVCQQYRFPQQSLCSA